MLVRCSISPPHRWPQPRLIGPVATPHPLLLFREGTELRAVSMMIAHQIRPREVCMGQCQNFSRHTPSM